MAQVRLPYALPSPEVARAALARARADVGLARGMLATMSEAWKVCKERVTDAEDTCDAAAADLESHNTPETNGRYLASVGELRERRRELAGALRAKQEAKEALKLARKRREAADDDLIALNEGRRGDA